MIFNLKPLTGEERLHEIQSDHYVFYRTDEIPKLRQERLTNVPRNR